MGGLTVLRALAARLPQETFVYLGDTARLPYGTKSAETVQAYALQATRLLIAEGVKMVVIAPGPRHPCASSPPTRRSGLRGWERSSWAARSTSPTWS
jgi:glutamate racemase